MSWTMADVKAGLGEALASVGLRVYSESIPEQVSVPCAIVGDGDIFYSEDFDEGDRLEFGVLILASRADSRSGQNLLGEYRQRAGSKSIITALEADGGLPFQGTDTAESVEVRASSAPATVDIAGITYLSTEFSVEVLAS